MPAGFDDLQRIEAARRQEDEQRRRRASEAAALVDEVKQLRAELETKLATFVEKSDVLRNFARRHLRGDEDGQALVAFANQHLRLGGALSNGFRRMASADRTLAAYKQASDERRQQEEQMRQRIEQSATRRATQENLLGTGEADDFEQIYGEVMEEVADA